MAHPATNRRKVIVSLATALVAGAIAVGSGATFTSQTSNSGNAYNAGTLTQSNSVSGALFNLTNLKPGDAISKTVTITNTGSLPADFTLSGTGTDGFATGMLTFSVAEGATPVLAPTGLGTLAAVSLPSAAAPVVTAWAPGEAHTYTFTVALSSAATNADQGAAATAAFTWDAIQEDGTNFTGAVTSGSVNTAPGVHDGGSVTLP